MTDPDTTRRIPDDPPPTVIVRIDYLKQVMQTLQNLDRLGQLAVLRAALEIILADRI